MKVKVTLTLNIDPDAWREEMLADGDASLREVRSDVQGWATNDVVMNLRDRGLLL